MNLLRKCPNCNNRFKYKEIVVARGKEVKETKKYRGRICCKNCNSSLIIKHPIYRNLYIFFAVYLTIFSLSINIQSDILAVIVILLILLILNYLILLFDIIEHRFNRYIIDKK